MSFIMQLNSEQNDQPMLSSPNGQQTVCYKQPGYTFYNCDCLEALHNIQDETVDMIFADPPFDVNIKYTGYKDKRADYYGWCAEWIAECFRILKPTGSFYLMTITRHLPFTLAEMSKHGIFINLINWKNVASANNKRSFWQSYQPIAFYGKTDGYKFHPYAQKREADEMVLSWNKDRAKDAKFQMMDYWADIPLIYAGSIKHKEAVIKKGTNSKAHPCQMPEMLPGRAIMFSTDEGDIVFDPFTGSGTTAISCQKLGRQFIGSELSPEYFELAKERIGKKDFELFR